MYFLFVGCRTFLVFESLAFLLGCVVLVFWYFNFVMFYFLKIFGSPLIVPTSLVSFVGWSCALGFFYIVLFVCVVVIGLIVCCCVDFS